MALELVDQKRITILDVVKAVVDEKLFAPGYGIIDLITVMDVHVHCLLVIIEMCKRKGVAFHTVFHGFFA